jgi:SAM-dependent methyltransferase
LGYRVIGIDNNRGALERAREIGGESVQYHELDMRALRSLGLRVDALLLLWQSFGQFDDATNEDILMQIHQGLHPGGRFVLDIYNRDFFENRCGRRQSRRGGRTVTETKEIRGNRLSVRLDYAGSDEGDRFDWRVFTTDELLATATALGFHPVVSCANWDESISPSSDIPRTQFVFERR